MLEHRTGLAAMVLLTAASAAGCGGGPPEPRDATDQRSGVESGDTVADRDGDADIATPASPKAAPKGMPTKCAAQDGDYCLPPSLFVKRLCGGDYPSVALAMFHDGTPWTRVYMKHDTEAWDASGGGAGHAKLVYDEELLILRSRKAKTGGMTVSGTGDGVDALRWDGACVTLDGGEVTLTPPPAIKNARVIWKTLEYDIKEGLKEDEAVRPAFLKWKRECKGVDMGLVSKKCVKADGALSGAVAAHVRAGGKLVPPSKFPK